MLRPCWRGAAAVRLAGMLATRPISSRVPLASLPNPAAQACLHRAVTLISREMSASFLDQGEDLPPWRTPQALLSKWQLGGAVMSSTAGGAGCSAWATQGRPAGFALGAGGLFGDAKRAPGAD